MGLIPREEWDDEQRDAMQIMAPGYDLPYSNVLGFFANHPALSKSFLRYNRNLIHKSKLSKRTQELAILRVAWVRRCRFEWAQHVIAARRVDVTDAEIEDVRTGAPTLLNRAVDDLLGDARLSDRTYAELHGELGDDQALMEFIFLVGTYAMLAMNLNTFDVPLDPGVSEENFTTR